MQCGFIADRAWIERYADGASAAFELLVDAQPIGEFDVAQEVREAYFTKFYSVLETAWSQRPLPFPSFLP